MASEEDTENWDDGVGLYRMEINSVRDDKHASMIFSRFISFFSFSIQISRNSRLPVSVRTRSSERRRGRTIGFEKYVKYVKPSK